MNSLNELILLLLAILRVVLFEPKSGYELFWGVWPSRNKII